jgi:hypothetical protein
MTMISGLTLLEIRMISHIRQKNLLLLLMSAICLLLLRKTPAFPSYPKRNWKLRLHFYISIFFRFLQTNRTANPILIPLISDSDSNCFRHSLHIRHRNDRQEPRIVVLIRRRRRCRRRRYLRGLRWRC